MAVPAYTTQLFIGTLGAGVSPLYTVPVGFVAVVRSIYLYGNYAQQSPIAIGVDVAGSLAAIIAFANPLLPGAIFDWEGRAAVNAEQVIEATTVNAGALALVTGYLLTT